MARAAACLLLCMVALAMVATHAELVAQDAPGRKLKNIIAKPSHEEPMKQWGEPMKKWTEPMKKWNEHDNKWTEPMKKWTEPMKKWNEHDNKWNKPEKEKWEHKMKKDKHEKKCVDVCYRKNEHGITVVCGCHEHYTEKKQVCH